MGFVQVVPMVNYDTRFLLPVTRPVVINPDEEEDPLLSSGVIGMRFTVYDCCTRP